MFCPRPHVRGGRVQPARRFGTLRALGVQRWNAAASEPGAGGESGNRDAEKLAELKGGQALTGREDCVRLSARFSQKVNSL